MRATWKRGSFTRDPGGCVKKALRTGISLHRSSAEKPGRGLVYQELGIYLLNATG